ncbi:carbohydrate ABC transporter permease [Ruminococcus sp. CLA-AA-H200]|uniref:Carbohydrate ABC transporter permease n=1 Tax=Ruminococcus turbiniformis TaxID=2881258 RepID=A0ABS8G5P8_9FIRM|nr:carbohydrate ABC transporter permease [Ruminococcus turbiniformis]MCC2256259.1 carbohydrate ABC transporter permease [Ruminococcus turbiniformis]
MSRKRRKQVQNYIARYFFIIIWTIIALLPIYTAVMTSLTPFEKLGERMLYPKYFYWQNFTELASQTPMWEYLKASIVYALGTSVFTIIISILAAYALSRFVFRFKVAFMMIIVAIQVIPQIVIVTPLYGISNSTGLYDTYIIVILAMVASAIANPILLLKGFFDSISVSLEEAAAVDGCTKVMALVRIILPISKPAVTTAFALSFFSGWDAYLYPMILTSSAGKVSMTVGLSRMVDLVTPWNWIMAGTVIAIIPPIVIYLIAQKYLIGGLTAGSDK